jgi:hypothetical protein
LLATQQSVGNVPNDRELTGDELLGAANATSLVRLALTAEKATTS